MRRAEARAEPATLVAVLYEENGQAPVRSDRRLGADRTPASDGCSSVATR